MNLSKLFQMQKELDAKIIKEKGLEDMDRLPYLILALQVELGECANEWRGFKYWSKDQEPRTNIIEYVQYVGFHGPTAVIKNPLLEEYVDCLHFILSIGLHLEIDINTEFRPFQWMGIMQSFSALMREEWETQGYEESVSYFVGLGKMLGFDWDLVEQSYMDKNAVNHERQATGY